MSKKALQHDEIGYWSEVKLDIVKKYASAYSTIMAKQPWINQASQRHRRVRGSRTAHLENNS
jgi:hypothetical protein